mmetsp:Transcript_16525/g.45135  ORF Transcript_16525/g.45135 Transcript_16525/m.45135 type:complete len:213 (+) Transcript_16525:3070-3708(+)
MGAECFLGLTAFEGDPGDPLCNTSVLAVGTFSFGVPMGGRSAASADFTEVSSSSRSRIPSTFLRTSSRNSFSSCSPRLLPELGLVDVGAVGEERAHVEGSERRQLSNCCSSSRMRRSLSRSSVDNPWSDENSSWRTVISDSPSAPDACEAKLSAWQPPVLKRSPEPPRFPAPSPVDVAPKCSLALARSFRALFSMAASPGRCDAGEHLSAVI